MEAALVDGIHRRLQGAESGKLVLPAADRLEKSRQPLRQHSKNAQLPYMQNVKRHNVVQVAAASAQAMHFSENNDKGQRAVGVAECLRRPGRGSFRRTSAAASCASRTCTTGRLSLTDRL